MNSVPDPAIADKFSWTRAAVIVVRIALLVFLVWALVSARFPEHTPVADDATSSSQDNRSAGGPCDSTQSELG
jgi:hypothetical protein